MAKASTTITTIRVTRRFLRTRYPSSPISFVVDEASKKPTKNQIERNGATGGKGENIIKMQCNTFTAIVHFVQHMTGSQQARKVPCTLKNDHNGDNPSR